MNIKVAVVIPWRETPSRLPLKEYVDSWYKKNMPEVKIFYTDSGHKIFNRSASKNLGGDLAKDYDVVIYNDADTIPNLASILDGIDKTYKDELLCNPFDSCRIVDFTNTQKILSGNIPMEDIEYSEYENSCGGILITTPKIFNLLGNYDENFKEWGYEDTAIYFSHLAIMDTGMVRIPGPIYVLSHEVEDRVPDLLDYGRERIELYSAAKENREEMMKLIGKVND